MPALNENNDNPRKKCCNRHFLPAADYICTGICSLLTKNNGYLVSHVGHDDNLCGMSAATFLMEMLILTKMKMVTFTV